MHHHRFPPSPDSPSPAAGTTFSPTGFVWVPLPLPPGTPPALVLLSLWIYHVAFEQACAVARPSWVERDVLAVWN
jgi:hypothetical protein